MLLLFREQHITYFAGGGYRLGILQNSFNQSHSSSGCFDKKRRAFARLLQGTCAHICKGCVLKGCKTLPLLLYPGRWRNIPWISILTRMPCSLCLWLALRFSGWYFRRGGLLRDQTNASSCSKYQIKCGGRRQPDITGRTSY